MDVKYQIFISSTYTDLKEARERITKAILSSYHIPIGMEMFNAGDEEQWEVIKKTIDVSDYYVLIIGHRYGSLTDEGISYTEKEYRYAKEKGIPIHVLLSIEKCTNLLIRLCTTFGKKLEESYSISTLLL